MKKVNNILSWISNAVCPVAESRSLALTPESR